MQGKPINFRMLVAAYVFLASVTVLMLFNATAQPVDTGDGSAVAPECVALICPKSIFNSSVTYCPDLMNDEELQVILDKNIHPFIKNDELVSVQDLIESIFTRPMAVAPSTRVDGDQVKLDSLVRFLQIDAQEFLADSNEEMSVGDYLALVLRKINHLGLLHPVAEEFTTTATFIVSDAAVILLGIPGAFDSDEDEAAESENGGVFSWYESVTGKKIGGQQDNDLD